MCQRTISDARIKIRRAKLALKVDCASGKPPEYPAGVTPTWRGAKNNREIVVSMGDRSVVLPYEVIPGEDGPGVEQVAPRMAGAFEEGAQPGEDSLRSAAEALRVGFNLVGSSAENPVMIICMGFGSGFEPQGMLIPA